MNNKNLEILAERFPELIEKIKNTTEDSNYDYKLISAKNGQPTLQVLLNENNIYLHSAYDPGKEAQKIITNNEYDDGDVVFVFGLGLGYQLMEIVKKIGVKNVQIFVLEKDATVFRMALEAMDLSRLSKQTNVFFLVNLTEREVYTKITSLLNPGLVKNIFFFENSPSLRLYESYYTNVLKSLRDYISFQLSNIATMFLFKGSWVKNTLKNLSTTINSPGVEILKNKFSNIPAIIVSAGPSLDKNVKELKKAKGKAIIIAVGTSLRTLLKEKITPDMVVAFDASDRNFEHFKGFEYDHIPLIFDPIVCPLIVDNHKGIKYVFNHRFTYLTELLELQDKGLLEAGGSVANCAFSLAVLIGSNPITLIGQDLAYTDGRTHSNASIYGKNKVEIKNSSKSIEVPGYYGGKVMTSRSLYAFLKWFENKIEFIDREVFNATEGGARIKGTENLPLKEVIEKYCKDNINVQEILKLFTKQYHSNKNINIKLNDTIKQLNQLSSDSKDAAKLCSEYENMYRKRIFKVKNVKKAMHRLDSLDLAIKNNKSSRLLDEMLQDVLLASERGTLIKENKNDDDFTIAQKRMKSLKVLYEKICEASEWVSDLFKEALNSLATTYNEGVDTNAKQ